MGQKITKKIVEKIDHEPNIENLIIILPIPLLQIIILYCPLFVKLKENELVNMPVDWRYLIYELFNIRTRDLSPIDAIINFLHLTIVKQIKMINLVHEHQITKTNTLVKRCFAGSNYYLLWMTDNTILINTREPGRDFNKNSKFEPIYGLKNVRSIITNSYYTLIITNKDIWYIDGDLVNTFNTRYPLRTVATDIVLINGDRIALYLLGINGHVFYMYIYNSAGERMENFIPLDFGQKCIDMISIHSTTFFKLANGKIVYINYDFDMVTSVTSIKINEILNFTFSRDNILQYNDNFLLLLNNNTLWCDGIYDTNIVESIIDPINIKKMIRFVDRLINIIFFLTVDHNIFFTNISNKKMEKLAVFDVEDMMITRTGIIFHTMTHVYEIDLKNVGGILTKIAIYTNFPKPIINFFGGLIRLSDGTLITHSGILCMEFSKKINLVDLYSEYNSKNFIFVIGNDIFFQIPDTRISEIDNRIVQINLVSNKGKYVESSRSVIRLRNSAYHLQYKNIDAV